MYGTGKEELSLP